MIDKLISFMISQLGYEETGKNITKYSKFFDTTAWQFFNTKKQGAEWCAIFIFYCVYQLIGADGTRKAFGLPEPKDNCAAGVKFLYRYMAANGMLIKKPQKGCIVFFSNLSHVGTCERVDDKLHTIEGNKGNKVKRCTYTLGSSKIYAYAMPKYPEIKEEKPKDEQPANTKPVPAASYKKSFAKTYVTKLTTRLLAAPSRDMITKIPMGKSVKCYGFYTGNYLYVTYGKLEGYINKADLR